MGISAISKTGNKRPFLYDITCCPKTVSNIMEMPRYDF